MTNNKEQNKNILDSFIEKELKIKPNPFLAAKAMDKIIAQKRKEAAEPITSFKERTTYKLAFNIAMTVGVAAVLALGVFLGSSYTSKESFNRTNSSLALNINDTQLENLHLYDVDIVE